MCTIVAAAAGVVTQPHRAASQIPGLDRAKQAAQDAAKAAQKSATDAANQKFNSVVRDAAAEHVGDGGFVVALSPWSSIDGTKRVELARYSGSAYAISTGTGREIVLCDDKGVLPWRASLTIQTNQAAGALASTLQPAERAARGGSRAVTQAGSAASTDAAATTPSTTTAEKAYKLPSGAVTISLPAGGATTGTPTTGSVQIATVSGDVLAGTGTVKFAQATLPGMSGHQAVDFGIAFKARLVQAGDAAANCGGSRQNGSAGTSATNGKGAAGDAAAPRALAATTPAGAAGFAEGDVLTPKIDGVKLLSDARDDAKVAATLKKGDELVYLGKEQNGYIDVQGSAAEGWVKKVLVVKGK